MSFILGYIRVILPRYPESGQRKAMETNSIERIVQEGGKRNANGSRADLLRMVRGNTTVAVLHTFLLADPANKRKRGGTRADFWKVWDEIEERGGRVLELYTGLKSDNPADRDKMTREAVEALARGRHKTSASDKRGRPKQEFTPAQVQQAHDAWHSRKLKTWAAVQAKMPKGFSLSRAYKAWGARNTDNG